MSASVLVCGGMFLNTAGVRRKVSIWEKTKYTSIITVFIALSYFMIQNLVPFSPLDLTLPIDKHLPFVPEFVWIYHTLVPVLMLSCIFIIKRKDTFYTSCLSFIITASVLNMFYVLMPSFYPREDFVVEGAASWLVSLTREIDGSNNTFPSGHVALSWLLAFIMQQTELVKRNSIIRGTFFAWSSLIALSTLFLKQHYFVDVVSGIALAYMAHKAAQKIYHMKKKPAWLTGSKQKEEQLPQLAE